MLQVNCLRRRKECYVSVHIANIACNDLRPSSVILLMVAGKSIGV